MWCARCQSDVAAEVSQDTRSVRCATCGTEIGDSISTRTESRTRQARALLERWSRERGADPFESGSPAPAIEREARPEPSLRETPSPKPPFNDAPSPRNEPDASPATRSMRIDAAHGTPESDAGRSRNSDRGAASAPSSVVGPAIASRATHTDRGPKKINNWASTAGQWLAYSGILGLMTGTCLVILGYFRGPESYVPTGWLITTAGQMLLFLGVVTLVSSGIEESSNTMSEQIGRLDERLIRIEKATDSLRPPHSLSEFERQSEAAPAGTAQRMKAT